MAQDSLQASTERHDFDTSYTNEFDNDQSNADIITPAAGKALRIASIAITTEATSGSLRLKIGSNTLFTYFASSGNNGSGLIQLTREGGNDEAVKLTSTLGAGSNYFVLVNYEEIE